MSHRSTALHGAKESASPVTLVFTICIRIRLVNGEEGQEIFFFKLAVISVCVVCVCLIFPQPPLFCFCFCRCLFFFNQPFQPMMMMMMMMMMTTFAIFTSPSSPPLSCSTSRQARATEHGSTSPQRHSTAMPPSKAPGWLGKAYALHSQRLYPPTPPHPKIKSGRLEDAIPAHKTQPPPKGNGCGSARLCGCGCGCPCACGWG